MKITFIDTGYFKLDGGAMYGVVPKVMWEKKNPPDQNNQCTWAARCMLIEDGNKRILVDTGLGDKQDDKFKKHFQPHGKETLLDSLAKAGFKPDDITDVLLTHLHFDHVGGATKFNEEGIIVPTFPKANYWTNEAHWNWAKNPNIKEAASFLTENLDPLMQSGQLDMLPISKGKDYHWTPNISLRVLYGHTEAMMMPMLDLGQGQRFTYCADLIPSAAHIREPWVLAYDIRPLVTIEEKKQLITEALAEHYTLGFEHDPKISKGKLFRNERNRIDIQTNI